MTERYCEGERFTGLSFAGEVFESCDFADCVFVDSSFTKCELDHTTLNECKFVRCEITGLRSTHSSVQSLDFEDCHLQEIGELYGRCRSTAWHHIHSALQMLHEEMEVLSHE